MSALLVLAEAGAKVVGFKWLHAKAIWIDSEQAMVMSANLQADGLNHGFELGVRLTGGRAAEVRSRLTRWAEGAEWRLAVAPMLGDASGKVMLWQRGKLLDGVVQPSVDVELGTVTASSAHELMAQRPVVPSAGQISRLGHELRCTWAVVPPLLAPKAKEVLQPTEGKEKAVPYTPPVFREPGGRLVVAVRSHGELARAQDLMYEVRSTAIVLAEGAAQ